MIRRQVVRRYSWFTLIEVVVALAVLSLGIMAGMSLIAASRDRTMKAATQWREQHILAQAMEYFMLADAGAGIPDEFFPYRDYSVVCEYAPPQGLPDDVPLQLPGWKLNTMTVSLRDNYGKVIRKISVDRIVKDGEL